MLWLVYTIISIILMSLNIFLVKILVKKVKPLSILFYQYIIAIPLVLIYSLISGASITSGNYYILLLGIIYFAGIAIMYIGLSKGPLSKVSPIFSLQMLVTASLGITILLEPLSIKLILGLILGVIGIYFLGGVEK